MKNILLMVLIGLSLCLAQERDGVPNLQLKRLNGSVVQLDSFLDKGPVLLDFWATWCAPCKKEMVYLDQFEKTYRDSGFSILAISEDSQKSLGKVRAYVRSKKFSFQVFLDPNQQIAQKLNARLLPTTILLDENGRILWRHQGYLPGDEKKIEQKIREALNMPF